MNVEILINPERANILCEILKKLKLFTESFVLMINNERLYIQGMDSSHIIIFDLNLSSDWFDTIDVKENNNYEFGLHTTILAKILSIKSEKQYMRIYNEKNNIDKLGIDFINGNESDYDKFFEIPLMDIDYDLLEIPTTDYDASIIMEAKNYKNIIDDFNGLDFQDVKIKCCEENIEFSSESSQGNMQLCVKEAQIHKYEIIQDEEIKNNFNLKFISKMCQFKVSKYISIQQSNGIPIEIKYLLNPTADLDGNDDNSSIEKLTNHWFKFYLAPCTSDDDELY